MSARDELVSGSGVWRCRRGAVAAEYIVLVVLVGLTLAQTLVSLGPGMVTSWSFARQVLYGPFP